MHSLKFKFTIIILCILLVSTVLSVGVATTIAGSDIKREALGNILQDTKDEALVLDEWLTKQEAKLQTLGNTLSTLTELSEDSMDAVFKSITDDNPEYFDVYMGFPDGHATAGSGYEFDYSYWRSYERDWYKLALKDVRKTHVAPPYVDDDSGELCITVVQAVIRDRLTVGVVAADILIAELENAVSEMTFGSRGYAMLLDENGDILVHPGAYAPDVANEEFKNIAEVSGGDFAGMWKTLSAGDGSYNTKDTDGIRKYFTSCTISSTGWRVISVLPAHYVTQPIVSIVLWVIPVALLVLLVSALIFFNLVKKNITNPLIPFTEFLENASRTGDIIIRPSDMSTINKYADNRDEIGRCIKAAATFFPHVGVMAEALDTVAGGDLSYTVEPLSEQDVLAGSLQMMLDNLNEMFVEIDDAATQVLSEASQIAHVAQALAQGAADQSFSIDTLSETVNNISAETKQKAGLGTAKMDQMVKSVEDIRKASNNISKIISVIDDIAFQSNILALNASVEAARAGKHGKGFAVVAEEVKTLAARSQDAARETNELILNSLKLADQGADIARETQASLESIVVTVDRLSEVLAGIDQVASVVQKNKETAQESADASEQMNHQSRNMRELLDRFSLRDDMRSA